MNKIFFCGDIVLQNSGINRIADSSLKKIINECEVVCGNLEGSIRQEGVHKLSKKGPHVEQNKSMAELLKEAGFTVLLGANNHIMDYQYLSAQKTKEILEPIEVIGFGKSSEEVFKPYVYVLENKKTVAILSIAEGGFGAYYEGYSKYGYARMCESGVKDVINNLKEKYDYVFVCCHAGAENLIVPLPEIREIYRSFIDWGASAVVGSHPHVAQGVEAYKEGIIVYSTGNFLFKSDSEFYNPKSIVIVFDLSQASILYNIIPICATDGGVKIYEDKQWINEIDYRTRLLFDDKEYIRIVDDFCESQYHSFYCQTFIGAAGNLFSKTLKDRIRSIFYLLVNSSKIKFNNEWLYHNYLIETHRWIIMRALKIIEREEDERITHLPCR